MSIPVELITMGASTVLSAVMTLWSMNMKAKAQQQEILIAGATLQDKIFSKARRFKGTKSFQFTRRLIALSCIGAIVVLPKVAALLGYDVTVGWTEIERGFWFWSTDDTIMKWHSVKGLVTTPFDTHLVSSIIGFYFGNSMVRNA